MQIYEKIYNFRLDIADIYNPYHDGRPGYGLTYQ